MSAQIPDKQFFKIGEVSRIAGVKPHVLRYWEREFRAMRPQKTRSNQRLYSRRDLQTVLLIKKLLYTDGFTIAGANKRLAELRSVPAANHDDLVRVLEGVREQLVQLVALIDQDEELDPDRNA